MSNDLALLSVALGALISIGVAVAIGVLATILVWFLGGRN